MNRLFTGILVATSLLLILSDRPAGAQPLRIPHENPAKVSGTVAATSLIRFYANVSGSLANREYQDARDALSDFSKGHIPASIKRLFDTGVALAMDLTTTMNELEFLLDSTSQLARSGDIEAGRQALLASETAIGDAVLLISEFSGISEMLGAELGILTSPENPLAKTYETHTTNLDQVDKLLVALDDVRAELDLDPMVSVNSKFFSDVSLEVFQIKELEPGTSVSIGGSAIWLNAPIKLVVQAPWFIGMPQTLRLNGEVQIGFEPLPNAQLHIKLGGHSATADAGPDGHFSAEMDVPFSLTMTGPQKLLVVATTLGADYTPATATKWILVINPLYAAALAVAFLITASLVHRKSKRSAVSPISGKLAPTQVAIDRPAPFAAPESEAVPPESAGARGKVLTAYLTSVAAISAATGTAGPASMTFSEYARTVVSLGPSIDEPFTALTAMAEAVVYSAHPSSRSADDRAEMLTRTVQREMSRVTA